VIGFDRFGKVLIGLESIGFRFGIGLDRFGVGLDRFGWFG
jgi:hypothetical protein